VPPVASVAETVTECRPTVPSVAVPASRAIGSSSRQTDRSRRRQGPSKAKEVGLLVVDGSMRWPRPRWGDRGIDQGDVGDVFESKVPAQKFGVSGGDHAFPFRGLVAFGVATFIPSNRGGGS
jgi:hypothetical protein